MLLLNNLMLAYSLPPVFFISEHSIFIFSFFIPASNEPSVHASMSIWQLPRGSDTPQLCCATSLMPHSLLRGFDSREGQIREHSFSTLSPYFYYKSATFFFTDFLYTLTCKEKREPAAAVIYQEALFIMRKNTFDNNEFFFNTESNSESSMLPEDFESNKKNGSRKSRRRNTFIKKAGALAMSAVLFGGLAAGTFQGVNTLIAANAQSSS